MNIEKPIAERLILEANKYEDYTQDHKMLKEAANRIEELERQADVAQAFRRGHETLLNRRAKEVSELKEALSEIIKCDDQGLESEHIIDALDKARRILAIPDGQI